MREPLPAAAWIFDLEGTLYRGGEPIPGAVATVRRLRTRGLPVRFLTNTTSRGRAGLVDRLVALGFEAEPEEVFCPSAAAAAWLGARGATVRLLVAEAARADFEGIPESDRPDQVVLGDLGEGWSYVAMNRAFRDVHEGGAGLVGLARSRFWLADDGLRLDVGPFLHALEYATGRRAKVFGKPEPAIFEAVLDDLGLEADAVVMVGDDPRTDAVAADAVGLRTVLVRTGKYRGGHPGSSELPEGGDGRLPAATRVVDSVADLG